MLSSGFLAAVHLVLITHSQLQMEPDGQKAPDAQQAPAEQKEPVGKKGPVEKILNGADETVIWVTSKTPRVKIETHRGVSFYVDFATHASMCLAHISAELSTQPKGLTLSFSPTNGMLSAGYDKDAGELQIFMNKQPICKLPLKLSDATTRVLLRQREQLALFAIPPDGSHATLVWLGRVYYTFEFRNAPQYDLCHDVKITMGKKQISSEEFRGGIKLDALDEISDVVVTGVSPAGEPFQHRYTFDYKTVCGLVDGAYGSFMKAAGNASPQEESAIKTAPVELMQ